MTSPAAVPGAIERGLVSVRSISSCQVNGEPTFHSSLSQWSIAMSLRIDTPGEFVGKNTNWSVLVSEAYPLGPIGVYPAIVGGLTATFPHQERNDRDHDQYGWRGGKLCLESPYQGARHFISSRDPVGNVDTRLQWHVERALDWLDAAASGSLVSPGDPFELPRRPNSVPKGWLHRRVVHDETAATFFNWTQLVGKAGVAHLSFLPGIKNALVVERFDSPSGVAVRSWQGRPLEPLTEAMSAVWWLWPRPAVIRPWLSPRTWGDLRRAGKALDVDVDAFVKALAPRLQGAQDPTVLVLGYPIPSHVGDSPTEVHWDAILLPELPAIGGKPPKGFRSNSSGWWQRDRQGALAAEKPLRCLHTENWSPERLQSRGRLQATVRQARILVIGVGALGACLSEFLVRSGVNEIALLDGDFITAGNICRHTATLNDVGASKVRAVADRLRQLSASVRVTELEGSFPLDEHSIVDKLEPYDILIDCTASDDVLRALSLGWWSIPRVFASFSLGFGGSRLFSYGFAGHQFPEERFQSEVRPWLDHESATWSDAGELLEGAGCWSPLFPARLDDVVLAAATCAKELETIAGSRPDEPRFRVFEQLATPDGFAGFSLRIQPLATKAPL